MHKGHCFIKGLTRAGVVPSPSAGCCNSHSSWGWPCSAPVGCGTAPGCHTGGSIPRDLVLAHAPDFAVLPKPLSKLAKCVLREEFACSRQGVWRLTTWLQVYMGLQEREEQPCKEAQSEHPSARCPLMYLVQKKKRLAEAVILKGSQDPQS